MVLHFGCKDKMPAENSPAGNTLKLEKVCSLPAGLNESSGLVKIGENFLSINDKGGANEIYQFNDSGSLLKTFSVAETENKDWEDLSIDENGNLYIADSGNNDNERKNLRIYKISNVAINGPSHILTPEVFPFKYENQLAFPPEKPFRHFDCEALITLQGAIHLFTKDRSKPFAGITNHYVLNENSELAEFQSSFQTEGTSNLGSITAAANTTDGKKVVLTSNGKCWIFSNFSGIDFFSGTIEEFYYDLELQVEGIFFGDNCTLYLSDEKSKSGGMNLYRLNICS